MGYIFTLLESIQGATAIDIFSLATIKSDIPVAMGILDEWTYPSRAQINSLMIRYTINSIPEVAIPEIELLDSQSEQIKKSLDLQWNSQRIGLDVFLNKKGKKFRIAEFSLINLGYPNQQINILESIGYEYGIDLNTTSLSIGLKDLGYGLPSGSDEIICHGEAMVNFTSFKPIEEEPVEVNTALLS